MATEVDELTGVTLDGRHGRYRIKSALGAGGMATVYLGSDVGSGRYVAIKLPHAQILNEEGFAARFTREIKSLIRLAHPNIVKVIDIGEHRGAPFAVLQYLALGSLRLQQPLDLGDGRVWPMPPGEIADWLGPIASALDYVNAKGYVHRDVKPENIMFDADGNPYLGDFGVIKARADVGAGKPQTVATGAGLVLGTPHYMAPEVLMGEQYDGRADQYSLACTVYEMLASRVPFPGEPPVAIVGHTTRPVPKLRSFVPDLPATIEQVVLKALSKKKEYRYRDCTAFAKEFAAQIPAPSRQVAGLPVAKLLLPTASPSRSVTPPPVPRTPGPTPLRTPGPTPPLPRPSTPRPVGFTPPPLPKRDSAIVCPYCRYEVNLPPHVRSKAIRCAGCRKVYLLDPPSGK
jgi:serine/threonine-protein kinase